MSLADRMARRVGTSVVDNGPLIDQVQSMCPNHTVKHVVLCRGTDRHVGPNKEIPKGEAPVRRMICIRRKHEDIHVETEWEPWEHLTFKGLRRKCVPARVNLTIFAQVRSKPDDVLPAPVIHDRPMPESPPGSKRARIGNPEAGDDSVDFRTISDDSDNATLNNQPNNHNDNSLTQNNLQHESTKMPERDNQSPDMHSSQDQQTVEREVIDLVAQKHGPHFQALKNEEQSWLLKVHRNMGHPGECLKARPVLQIVGVPQHNPPCYP